MEFNEPPPNCLKEPVVLGIDEAGRGPVLGSMVYACAYWPLSEDVEIGKMGFDDSKALTEAKRESLFDKLKRCGRIGYVCHHLHAHEISAWMLQKVPYSLNAMSHDAAIDLIHKVIDMGVNVSKVYVDTVGDPGYYQSKLTKAFAHRIEFTVSKKADSLYKCVSAASICAKVARDSVLKGWVFKESALTLRAALQDEGNAEPAPDYSAYAVESDLSDDEEPAPAPKRARSDPTTSDAASKAKLHPKFAGSGYPGDPLTKRWLKGNMDPVFGWPNVVRFSWSTCKDICEAECVRVEWEEEEEAKDETTPKLSAFFSAVKGPRAAATGRHKYFASRNISVVTTL